MSRINSSSDGITQSQILSDKTPFAGANIANLDVKLSSLQNTLLEVIAATTQQLTLPIKAAMDETTYVNIEKSGNNYQIVTYLSRSVDASTAEATAVMSTQGVWTLIKTFTPSTATRYGIEYASKSSNSTHLYTGYTINSTDTGTIVSISDAEPATSYAISKVAASVSSGATVRVYAVFGGAGSNINAYVKDFYLLLSATTGTIKSNAITKDANIGLRYWGNIRANLVPGATGSTIAIKICDSAGTPLHSNFVTIASTEYTDIQLMRPVVLIATGNNQTTWNFTSLSNADAFINELGVLAEAISVELALDGTNYTTLTKTGNPSPSVGQFYEDISNILAPKIIINGTGVINATTKLRVTYIVNIALSNTTIKVQIQLNRVASGDTSPSITPFIGDATKYVSAGQVAIT